MKLRYTKMMPFFGPPCTSMAIITATQVIKLEIKCNLMHSWLLYVSQL